MRSTMIMLAGMALIATVLVSVSTREAHAQSAGCAGAQCTEAEMRALVSAAGFPTATHDDALAVAWCESNWRHRATGASGERGLWQIHPIHPDSTHDPLGNARAAYRISKGGTDWSAWASVCRPSSSSAPPPGSSTPGSGTGTSTGNNATVAAGASCLNLRAGAGLNHAILNCLSTGTVVDVVGGPVDANGHTWLKVRTSGGQEGWVASRYLSSSATVAAGASCLNLRAGAGLNHAILNCLSTGTVVDVVGGPVNADGHTWLKVRTSGGQEGWVASRYLAR